VGLPPALVGRGSPTHGSIPSMLRSHASGAAHSSSREGTQAFCGEQLRRSTTPIQRSPSWTPVGPPSASVFDKVCRRMGQSLPYCVSDPFGFAFHWLTLGTTGTNCSERPLV
jgi:hypothetical protein